VQFFDQPPSRSWVGIKTGVIPLKPNEGLDKRNPSKISSPEKEKLAVACTDADKAWAMPIDNRDILLVDFQNSDLDTSGSPNL